MIFGDQPVGQTVPDVLWLVKIEPRQDHSALRQARDGFHQQERGAARPGGARQNDRVLRGRVFPLRNQIQNHLPLPRIHIERAFVHFDKLIGDADEILRAFPVPGHIRHIERADLVGGHAFALHLVDQLGQTV